jgi:glycosyltransferase involved in cell wall biosynthesis
VAATRSSLVVTIHDLAFLHHPDMFTKHGLRFFRRALSITCTEAAAVLVPSKATLEDCVDAGIERSRLRHVPWGTEVVDVEPARVAEVRDRFGLRGPYVVVVGTLEPRKNLRRLLDAWKMIDRDGVTLVVVGPSGWGDALGGSGLPENVTMTGFVDTRLRDALYAGAEASVYPSLFEGFGLPVLESMAVGCPVVTSSGTATEELVAGGAGIAVDPEDTAAIADGLTSVLDDDALRRRLVEAGRDRARAYTWEHNAELTVDAYRQVVA